MNCDRVTLKRNIFCLLLLLFFFFGFWRVLSIKLLHSNWNGAHCRCISNYAFIMCRYHNYNSLCFVTNKISFDKNLYFKTKQCRHMHAYNAGLFFLFILSPIFFFFCLNRFDCYFRQMHIKNLSIKSMHWHKHSFLS